MSIVVVVVPPPWHSFTPHVANASTRRREAARARPQYPAKAKLGRHSAGEGRACFVHASLFLQGAIETSDWFQYSRSSSFRF